MRILWFSIGAIALALGALGVLLPLLPTTPFVLLAAYCFARSSRRCHRWLLEHALFGPLIIDWQREGAISRRAKVAAAVSMAAILILSIVLGAAPAVLAIQAVVLSASATYVLSRPEPSRRAHQRT
ncbi:MAG: YbaN family protein [Pseudomonadota bacterium]